jgi:ADP-ribosyl-[dinitrogen reductase] hydrolase
MVGGGPFRLQPGQWTDDTSMALCLAESLVETGGFHARDQMERYVRWWREGHLSSTGHCFDIGNTVRGALQRFLETGDPWSGSTHPRSAGNGSIMRLAPVPMFFFGDEEKAVLRSADSSRTTHGADECVEACRLLGLLLHRALAGMPKDEILAPVANPTGEPPVSVPEISAPDGSPSPGSEIPGGPLALKIQAIADGSYVGKPESEIRGSGYVVESLEAALWCFQRTSSFRKAILTAANLGDDADTTAAVCGQIAGAHYGVQGIPAEWLEMLAEREVIEEMADRIADRTAERRRR